MTAFDKTLFDPCSQCGGELMVLGTLGNRVWARCRDCGIEEAEMLVEDDEVRSVINEDALAAAEDATWD